MTEINVLLIKLCGSLITDKSTPFTARDDVLARLSREISRTLQLDTRQGLGVIIAHGSWSFSHIAAAKNLVGDAGHVKADGTSTKKIAAHQLHA